MGDSSTSGNTKDNAQNRGEKRIIGRPFTPGNCANPGGRPKMTPEERENWKALANKCLARLNELTDDPDASPQFLIKTAEVAANRAWGTPTQAVEISGPEGNPLEVMTHDDRMARIKELVSRLNDK